MEDENLLTNIDNNTESSEVSAAAEESVVANQSAEDNSAAEAVESTEMNGNEKVVTEGKTNPSQFSHEEQMTHSFKRQLAKQRSKHEQEIANLRAEFEKRLADELDKRDHPEKYRPKTRADFKYDDEYVDYLADQRVNKVLDERLAAYQKEQERIAAQNEVNEEYKQMVDESVKRIYTTPEAENDWRVKVGEGMKKGLGKMLDTDEDLSNYILTSPIGPKIMYELATNKKAVKDLFVLGTLPNGKIIPRSAGDRMRKIEQLAEKLETAEINNNKAPVQPQKALGKPGITKEVKKDIWSDSKALLDMMYN